MIVIVGAGVSGLALGMQLSARRIPYILLESSDRVGGVVRTIELEGRSLDLGPQRLRASPELAGLRPHMGPMHEFTDDLPVLIARGGRLHPLPRSLGEALRTPAISTAGKLRAALEPFAALLPDDESLSAGAYLRRRVGREVYETFLGPLFGGLYGSDPDRMDATRTLRPGMEALGVNSFVWRLLGPRRAKGLMERSILVPADGMAALPRALLERQEHEVRLSCPVSHVGSFGGTGGFRVEAGDESIEATQVVVTTPPGPASRILREVAPALSVALGKLRMNPLALVHLDADRLPDGLGFQVAFDEPMRIRGVTFSGNLDGTGRTAVVFMGGMADPEVVDTPDAELERTAAAEFTRVTGIPARVLHLHRTAMPTWDRSWRALDDLRPPAGIHLLSAYSGRPGIIGRLREAERLARGLQRAG